VNPSSKVLAAWGAAVIAAICVARAAAPAIPAGARSAAALLLAGVMVWRGLSLLPPNPAKRYLRPITRRGHLTTSSVLLFAGAVSLLAGLPGCGAAAHSAMVPSYDFSTVNGQRPGRLFALMCPASMERTGSVEFLRKATTGTWQPSRACVVMDGVRRVGQTRRRVRAGRNQQSPRPGDDGKRMTDEKIV
jgi:hypothetical protein